MKFKKSQLIELLEYAVKASDWQSKSTELIFFPMSNMSEETISKCKEILSELTDMQISFELGDKDEHSSTSS